LYKGEQQINKKVFALFHWLLKELWSISFNHIKPQDRE